MGAGNKGPKPLHLVVGVLIVGGFAVGGLAVGGLAVGGLGLRSSHPCCRCAAGALLLRHLVDVTDHDLVWLTK